MPYSSQVVNDTQVDDFSFDEFLLDSDFDVNVHDIFEYKFTFCLEEMSLFLLIFG
jgi:hypothetical protein